MYYVTSNVEFYFQKISCDGYNMETLFSGKRIMLLYIVIVTNEQRERSFYRQVASSTLNQL